MLLPLLKEYGTISRLSKHICLPFDVSRYTVLVTDDVPSNIVLLKKLLLSEGYRVVTAANNEEALRMLKTHPISLIISDINRPEGNGFELMTTIRKKGITIPAIALSATMHNAEQHQKAIGTGFTTALPKPFTSHSILPIVKQLLLISEYKRIDGIISDKEANE